MEHNLIILFCCQTGKTSLVWLQSVCLESISITHFQQQLGWWNRISTFEHDTKLRGVSRFLEDKVRAQNNLTELKNGLKSINWNSIRRTAKSVCAIREKKLNGQMKNGRKLGSTITELELGVIPCRLSNNISVSDKFMEMSISGTGGNYSTAHWQLQFWSPHIAET